MYENIPAVILIPFYGLAFCIAIILPHTQVAINNPGPADIFVHMIDTAS